MTKDDARILVVELGKAAAATRTEIDEATLAVYVEDLADLPLEAVRGALQTLRRTLKWFPRVSEIREACHGSVGDQAAAAWAEACRITRLYRPEQRDEIAGPELREAVRLIGGWQRIAATKEEHLGFVEKDFLERYPGAVARAASGLALPSTTRAMPRLERVG